MALLTYDWQPPNTSGASNALEGGLRIGLAIREAQARQQAEAQQAAEYQQKMEFEREKFAKTSALELLQEQRFQRAAEMKEKFDLSRSMRDDALLGSRLSVADAQLAKYEADRAKTEAGMEPFVYQGGSEGGSGSPSGALGKVTSFGYAHDSTPDNASLGIGKYTRPTGAWNNPLKDTSLAVSPDIEAKFKAAGIKEGDSVALQLADGTVINRTWDDRTAQDDQIPIINAKRAAKGQKPLPLMRGRFDFYNQKGVDPRDGQAVVGFRPSAALGAPMTEGDPPLPPLPEGEGANSVASALRALSGNVSKGDLARVLPSVANALKTRSASTKAAGSPRAGSTLMDVPEGTTDNGDGTFTTPDGIRRKAVNGKLAPLTPLDLQRLTPDAPSGGTAETPKPASLEEQQKYDMAAPLVKAQSELRGKKMTLEALAAMEPAESYKKLAAEFGEQRARELNHLAQVMFPQQQKLLERIGGPDGAMSWVNAFEKKYSPGISPKPAPSGVAPAVFQTEAEARASGAKTGDIVTVINPATGKPARARLN